LGKLKRKFSEYFVLYTSLVPIEMDFTFIAAVFDAVSACLYCSTEVLGSKLWLLLRMQDEMQNLPRRMLHELL